MLLRNVIIILITIFFLFFLKYEYTENFEDKPKIFLYWENKPGVKKRPEYLDLCFESVKKNCSDSFDIILLNEKTVHNYLPNLRKDLDKKLSIPQKTDYIRYLLLYKYGGIWLDTDIIVVKDLTPIYKKLEKYDYVGAGCHENDCTKTGHPRPTNWLMMSRPNTKFIKMCIDECDKLLDENESLEDKYFLIGRELMWDKINLLMKEGWDYYHIDSKCQERDSSDVKYKNHRFISNESIDKNCLGKTYFVPVYNTAPGFPEWFKNLTKDEIMNSDLLVAKIFKLANITI